MSKGVMRTDQRRGKSSQSRRGRTKRKRERKLTELSIEGGFRAVELEETKKVMEEEVRSGTRINARKTTHEKLNGHPPSNRVHEDVKLGGRRTG